MDNEPLNLVTASQLSQSNSIQNPATSHLSSDKPTPTDTRGERNVACEPVH